MKIYKKIKIFILFTGLTFLGFEGISQDFSLKQCVEYANRNNGNIINAGYDIDISQEKVKEQIGTALPQIDASGSYIDNLMLSTTVLPGEMTGQPGTSIKVKMGTKYNVTGGLQLTQKIYDPTFGALLKADKILKQQSEQSLKQTTENVVYNVSMLYYQTLVIQKQTRSLEAAYKSSVALLESAELKLENGMANKIDVDKIRVSSNNTESSLHQSELNYKLSLNNLKYQMGMPVDSIIILTDTTLNINLAPLDSIKSDFSYENRADYRMQQLSQAAYELDEKRNKAGYLPTLSFNAYLGSSAMRNEFDFFNTWEWYQSSYIGFSLKIPVFDGLQRKARISQSKMNLAKSRVGTSQFQESIKVELSNSEIGFSNALENIRNEKANLDLSENVLTNTQLQFSQGTCSALDLVQSESAYRESLNNYYNKLLSLYLARLDLEKSKGTLINFINNQ
jgi:outer membrane protein